MASRSSSLRVNEPAKASGAPFRLPISTASLPSSLEGKVKVKRSRYRSWCNRGSRPANTSRASLISTLRATSRPKTGGNLADGCSRSKCQLARPSALTASWSVGPSNCSRLITAIPENSDQRSNSITPFLSSNRSTSKVSAGLARRNPDTSRRVTGHSWKSSESLIVTSRLMATLNQPARASRWSFQFRYCSARASTVTVATSTVTTDRISRLTSFTIGDASRCRNSWDRNLATEVHDS